MPYADGAAFYSFDNQHDPQCLEGTRVDLLEQITTWAENPDDKVIFWLQGMAGTGKSTISRTIASHFATKERLAGSFFFSRGGGERARAAKVFTTLALQLAKISPDLKRYISNAIAEDHDIGQQNLPLQWKRLIFEPLSKLGNNSPRPLVLFVIDALDECERQEDATMIIQILTQAKNLTSILLRTFITSRPEISIRNEFRNTDKSIHQDFALRDIEHSIVESDISRYLQHELDKIKRNRNLCINWPDEHSVKMLIQRTDRLFIYAATACRFISDEKFSPEEQLDLILQGGADEQSFELDMMYKQVLQQSFHEKYLTRKRDELSGQFKQVVGSIVVLLDPLSAVSLSNLLSVAKHKIDNTLRSLHSVLDVPQDEVSPIRLLHLSFHDFLVDKERCTNDQFWIYEKKAHSYLVESCLQVMSDALRRDICNLQKPGCLISELDRKHIDQCLPIHVQYACRYWIDHLQRSDIDVSSNNKVHKFLQKHFLHWLEALSLIGKMPEAIYMITAFHSMLTVSKIHGKRYNLRC